MNPTDISSTPESPQVESTTGPVSARPLSNPGFVRVQVDRTIIELTWNKDEADALPSPIPFTEGTCEC